MNRSIINLRGDLSALQAELREVKSETGIIDSGLSGDTGRLKKFYKLHEAIVYYFDLDELHRFMTSLGIEPENRKPYESKPDQALDLVLHMNREGRLIEMTRALEQSRPHVAWKEIYNG